jgi:hypothetical protein
MRSPVVWYILADSSEMHATPPSALKKEAARFSGTSVNIHQRAQRNVPEDNNFTAIAMRAATNEFNFSQRSLTVLAFKLKLDLSGISTSHLGDPGSSPGQVMWDSWWTKWHWGRFSPSTSVSPANSHSTNCSIFIIYPTCQVDSVSLHSKKLKKEKPIRHLKYDSK